MSTIAHVAGRLQCYDCINKITGELSYHVTNQQIIISRKEGTIVVTGSHSLRAQLILDELKKCGTTHIVWLPDTEARFMHEAIRNEPSITLVPVSREGECLGIAAGLMLGGKQPVVLHQSTGFFESGDSVRGIALDLQLPLLLMIGYRGYQESGLVVDSAAVFLEPILNAWGIKYYLVASDDDAENISRAFREAQETKKPVAVLIRKEYE